MTIVRKFLVLVAALGGLAAVSGAGSASAMLADVTGVDAAPQAPGDALAQINPVVACAGVGVAYDGTNILFTCGSDAVVHKTDLTGADLGGVTILGAGGATPGLDAIAYDPTEGALYGGDLDGAGTCRIWSADLGTGMATLKFGYVDSAPLARCSAFFYDGLTVDTTTNTLWTSADVNDTIHHFNKDGTSAGPDIPFTTLTAGMCPWAQGLGAAGCWNSGLAIGLDGNLFAGTANDGKIVQLDPSVPSILGTFATVGGRDEDLECGPLFTKTDGSTVETILSRDLGGRIDVLEAPAGTCQSPVQEVHGFMTGGGSVFTGDGARVTHGLELHCTPSDGANHLQVNWRKGRFHLTGLDSASCIDDPAISPSPPDASFDTMRGSGTGKYNGQAGASIEFTFADAGEPGRNDTATMTIKDASNNTVLSVTGTLKNGNHQAHEGG